ncbi:MAG: hypothetical protein R3F59_28455 [Myxococcota bacterium]
MAASIALTLAAIAVTVFGLALTTYTALFAWSAVSLTAASERTRALLREQGFARGASSRWAVARIAGIEVEARPVGFGVVLSAAVDGGGLEVRERGARPGGIPVGDPAFDARFLVRGSPQDLAQLTWPVRQALLAFRGTRVSWRRGALRATGAVSDQLAAAVHAIRTLPEGEDARLALLCADPCPEVRAGALLRLTDRAQAEALALPCLDDPEEIVRASAALALHDGGIGLRTVSQALLAAVCAPTLQLRLRGRAAEALLASGSEPERLVAGEALLRVPRLRRQAVALLSASGATGERIMLRWLRDASVPLTRTLLLALARVGTPASVPTLRAHQAAAPSDLARAIDHAIRAIHGRVGDLTGQLALAEDKPLSGSLSLADRDAGALWSV